jgi:hypothetical protein
LTILHAIKTVAPLGAARRRGPGIDEYPAHRGIMAGLGRPDLRSLSARTPRPWLH